MIDKDGIILDQKEIERIVHEALAEALAEALREGLMQHREVGEHRTYLGDSVYAEVRDTGMIRLATNNGLFDSNVIYLEPEVYAALRRYAVKHGFE